MLDPLGIWGPSGLQTEASLLTVLFGAGTTSRLFPGDALGERGPGMLGLLQDSEELSLSSLMTQLDPGSQNTCGPGSGLGRCEKRVPSGLLRLYAHAPALGLPHSLSRARFLYLSTG